MDSLWPCQYATYAKRVKRMGSHAWLLMATIFVCGSFHTSSLRHVQSIWHISVLSSIIYHRDSSLSCWSLWNGRRVSSPNQCLAGWRPSGESPSPYWSFTPPSNSESRPGKADSAKSFIPYDARFGADGFFRRKLFCTFVFGCRFVSNFCLDINVFFFSPCAVTCVELFFLWMRLVHA